MNMRLVWRLGLAGLECGGLRSDRAAGLPEAERSAPAEDDEGLRYLPTEDGRPGRGISRAAQKASMRGEHSIR